MILRKEILRVDVEPSQCCVQRTAADVIAFAVALHRHTWTFAGTRFRLANPEPFGALPTAWVFTNPEPLETGECLPVLHAAVCAVAR